MINKVTSSPNFKSQVVMVYSERSKDLSTKFYDSSTMLNVANTLKDNGDDNTVIFYPVFDQRHPHMMMYIIDPRDGFGATHIYNAKDVLNEYSKLKDRLKPIGKSVALHEFIG